MGLGLFAATGVHQALLLELGQMRKIPSCCPTLNGWVFLDGDSLLLASKKRRAPAGS